MHGVPGLSWTDRYRECADPLMVLAAAGAVTNTIRLGTAVLVAAYHPAPVLAKSLATLSRMTRGRVVAGLGSGWSSDEFAAMGVDFATRGRRIEEIVDACRRLWGADPVQYEDSVERVPPSFVGPKPIGSIPVLLGGGGTERARDRIARKADGWLPPGGWPIGNILEAWRSIRAGASLHGRDPGELELVPRATIVLGDRPLGPDRRPFQGSLSQVVDDLAALRDADEIVFDLVPSCKDADELIDTAFRIRDAVAEAGL
jgi:probable F420-dependent oxidoreductase